MDGDKGIVRRVTDQGPEVEVQFKIDYGAWPAFATALMGTVTVADDGSVDRVPPFKLPWAPRLYCTSVGDETPLTPRGGFDGWPYWDFSIVPATFGALTYQVEDDGSGTRRDLSQLLYTTTKIKVSGEVFQPPGSTYYIAPFGSSAKPADEALIGITRPKIEISMTRYMIPVIKLDATMSLTGVVNDNTITMGDHTFPRGCLLFLGASFEPRNDSSGYPVYDIEFNFVGNYQVEWNEFLGTDGDWHLINTAMNGSGLFPFDYISFDPLFSTTI